MPAQVNIDRIRGMSDLPLSPQGRSEAMEVARQLRNHGGVTRVISSPLARALETARIVVSYTGAHFGGTTPRLEPWHLGGFETQSSEEMAKHIEYFVHHPNEVVPGKGPMSGVAGESFNSFLYRFLPYAHGQMSLVAPTEVLVECCHYRNVKALEAWVAAGAKPDYSIDAAVMTRYEPKLKTANLYLLRQMGKRIEFLPVELAETGKLAPGSYFLRHGATALNGQQTGGST